MQALPRRLSIRGNKGIAPLRPDSDVPSGLSRGRKRAADQLKNMDKELQHKDNEDNNNNNITPQKSSKGKKPQEVQVVINSPPDDRPARRRMRTNEAGDAMNISDDSDTPLETELWFGTDKVCRISIYFFCDKEFNLSRQLRCNHCTSKDKSQCVPQWGATKPSTACTRCARCKRMCIPQQAWLDVVEELCPFSGKLGESIFICI